VSREDAWRAELSAYLEEHGFQVALAADPEEAAARMEEAAADLVVLQTSRSGEAGLGLCRRLSAQDGARVILVSDRAQEIDRIVGLEVGADDFVSPSCSHRELLARIRAVLRRGARSGPPAPAEAPIGVHPAPIRFAGWTLRPWKLEAQSPRGVRSVLTPGDLKLLLVFLEHPEQAITRERLSELLGLFGPNLRSLDTSISRLRRKLGFTPSGEPLIRTLHGVGYMLNCAVDGVSAAPTAAA
jgi:two-component system OmpR family response regulator